ncbi:MAG TPA: DUF1501 domain-containing protein [Pirellulales bacterium]|nr:DUF1501 domain-containing protein [Pirellulales bacterium]
MLTMLGPADRKAPFCDGITRRNFLNIGGLGMGGLSLAQLLSLDARAGTRSSRKSLIMIYLVGGPPHQDLFDLKPYAPVEIAGPYRPIATSVPGVEISEHLPRLAKDMDRFVAIRSIVGAQDDHTAYQCFTGRHPRGAVPAGGWPQLGSVVAALQGPAQAGVPPFVSACYTCSHGPYNEPGPGFAGVARSPFTALGESRQDMVLQGITPERLGDRRSMLTAFDRFRRAADASGKMSGMDTFTEQAMGILTSSRLVEALDVSREDPRTVERYGTGDPTVFIDGNGAPRVPQSMLLARRLVEAGVRVVSLNYSKWDWHGHPYGSTFDRCREDSEALDRSITALVDDLHERGLERDVTVIAWGEFGRTPRINANSGRDHWPRVSCALLAGGGMKMGQVIGATDRLGGEAVDRPVTFPEVFATLYHNLGIDASATTLPDFNGRPHYLVDDGAQPIRELL